MVIRDLPGPVDYAARVLLAAEESGEGQTDALAEVTSMINRMEADLSTVKAMEAAAADRQLPVATIIRQLQENYLNGEGRSN